eukprot:11790673-Alexandrium_andersonii.AAC.1
MHGDAATDRAKTLGLSWLLVQEVRLGPRQAKGLRARLGQQGVSVSFAGLPDIPPPPTRAGPRRR